jgi:hypothetical protein
LKNICCFIVVIIIAVIIAPLHTTADNHTISLANLTKKVFILSIPGLSFQEINPQVLENYPQLRRLSEQGWIGSLNTRTPFKGIEDSYLTLGAGAFASSYETYYGMHRNETKAGERAEDLYERFAGELLPKSEIMIPEISAIHQMNKESDYHAKPGLLGDILKQAGISAGVLGNRDRGITAQGETGRQVEKRSAPLMLMDGQGLVEHGVIDQSTLLKDMDRPFGVRTHYAALLNQLEEYPKRTVAIIELGDLDRLYEEKALYADKPFQTLKIAILGEMDRFIGAVVELMESEDTLMIFSPQVHMDALNDKSLLSPFIMYQVNQDRGVVSSDTTRRLGVISILDIAPSIISSYSLLIPSEMVGTPIGQHPFPGNLEWLQTELKEIEQTYRLRPQLLYTFVIYQMIILLLGLLFAFQNRYKFQWMTVPLYSILIAPLLMLRLDWLYSLSNLHIILIFFFLIIVVSILLNFLPTFVALGILSSFMVFVILADGFFGAEWMKRSVLGYDPMVGARYYGIGNEYMGILIGTAVLLISIGMHYYRSKYPGLMLIASVSLFILIIIYLASPSLGTNAGGAITAVVAFGIAGVRMFCGEVLRKVRWLRLSLLMIILGLAGGAVLWLLNYLLPSSGDQQSHIGRAMQMLFAGRIDVIGGIVARKLAMNWHLIGVSSWSKVLITSLFVMVVIVLRPRGVFERWEQSISYLMYGFSANAMGAIVVLLVNDSGIVAAATMIIFVAVPMLLIKLQDKRFSHSS